MNKKSCFLLVGISLLLMIAIVETSLLPWRLLSLAGKGLRFISSAIFRRGDKKMRLNVLIVFVCLWYFVGRSDGAVIVTSENQPVATLAPAGAVVEFTNFKIRTKDNRGLELKKIVVEKTGLGSIDSVANFLVIAKESSGVSGANTNRVVLSSSENSKDEVELINLPEDGGLPVFSKPVELTVAAVMKSDLSSYSGQVIYLQVKSIVLVRKKNGREVKIKGKFPIIGVGNTINSSLGVGSLNVEAMEGGIAFAITAGNEEPVGIAKLAVRCNPSDEKGEPNSYYLWIEKTGEIFPFEREDNILYVVFKERQIIEKGETLKIQIRQDEGNLLWEILGFYAEDIVAHGYYYNYRIMPYWVAEG